MTIRHRKAWDLLCSRVLIFHVLVQKFEHRRAANVVVGILGDEHSVFVVEGDTELDGETPDNVGVEIWSEHGVVESFN